MYDVKILFCSILGVRPSFERVDMRPFLAIKFYPMLLKVNVLSNSETIFEIGSIVFQFTHYKHTPTHTTTAAAHTRTHKQAHIHTRKHAKNTNLSSL